MPQTIAEALATTPHAALEDIARTANTTPLAVLEALPAGEVTALPGSLMVEVLEAMADWGEITLVVNTGPVILEAKAPLLGGTVAQGMYNFKGKPIGGHVRIDACARVAFVRRKLFGTETRSVQLYDTTGGCMFKVYLGRDENRQMIPAQIAAFDALERRLSEAVA
ncbi:heme utilization cystosolic carrier protein HutX [Rhodobacter lacus]|uniref:Heme utilization cystosolic carrier protein HutX n=1 Tax=Rhodobacter lacus TaxID=1641972 RepID=A0ABW5A655_9RHOB